ncbi:MAG: T9SS type A sorting domain-containing protein, partial [Bacteroidales bacterium]|nr:T9SS type A sorting domain-containing protein [Bacteroidales bacterium]
GNSWQQVMDDFPVYDISINPENNQNIWGVVYTGYTDWLLFFSNDGGQNWNLYEGFEDPYKWVTSMYADADFNLYVERETDEPGFLFSILKSTDNGNSWFEVDKLSNRFSGSTLFTNLRNRCQSSISKTDNIYFGTYYGIYHSEDGGITTRLKNTGLMNSYIKDLEIHPFNSDLVYAGGNQGLWKSHDACRTWESVIVDPVGFIKFDPLFPDTLYYGGRNPMRSYNEGITFQNIRHNVKGAIFDIAINPVSTNIVYLTSSTDQNVHPLYKSIDHGDNWSLVFVSYNNEDYTDIRIDPFYPDTIYFGRHRSIDGGITWEYDTLEIRIVAIHPDNSDILYASDGNNLKVSYDWGETFQLLDSYFNWTVPGPAIGKFTISKENTDYLFYCTPNDGIHYSANAGENWQKLEGSYENRTLDIIPLINENKYYIATHGDGVWFYDTTYVNTINDNLFIKDNNYLQVFPNPSQNETIITYKIENGEALNKVKSSEIKICIYDIHGRLINTLINENKTKGEHEIIWKGKDKNGKEVNSGLYLIRLQSGRNIQTQRLILIK